MKMYILAEINVNNTLLRKIFRRYRNNVIGVG